MSNSQISHMRVVRGFKDTASHRSGARIERAKAEQMLGECLQTAIDVTADHVPHANITFKVPAEGKGKLHAALDKIVGDDYEIVRSTAEDTLTISPAPLGDALLKQALHHYRESVKFAKVTETKAAVTAHLQEHGQQR